MVWISIMIMVMVMKSSTFFMFQNFKFSCYKRFIEFVSCNCFSSFAYFCTNKNLLELISQCLPFQRICSSKSTTFKLSLMRVYLLNDPWTRQGKAHIGTLSYVETIQCCLIACNSIHVSVSCSLSLSVPRSIAKERATLSPSPSSSPTPLSLQ